MRVTSQLNWVVRYKVPIIQGEGWPNDDEAKTSKVNL